MFGLLKGAATPVVLLLDPPDLVPTVDELDGGVVAGLVVPGFVNLDVPLFLFDHLLDVVGLLGPLPVLDVAAYRSGENGHGGPLLDEDQLVGGLWRLFLELFSDEETHLAELLAPVDRHAHPRAYRHGHGDFLFIFILSADVVEESEEHAVLAESPLVVRASLGAHPLVGGILALLEPVVVLLDEVERSALVFSEKLIENRRHDLNVIQIC